MQHLFTLTGRIDGLTMLTGKLCDRCNTPVIQIDIMRTESEGSVHLFIYNIDEHGVLSRKSSEEHETLNAALNALAIKLSRPVAIIADTPTNQ